MPADPRRQIVGIVLARNEDLRIRRAVENVAAFCDRLLLVDHASEDDTPRLLAALAARHPHATAHRVSDPRESHDLLKPFAGTATWVFGVDGDEIYDPVRLAAFRPRLLAGEFDGWWMILANVLHCDRLDETAARARGYQTPPCRSITKLYNFAAIRSWDGDTPERLHGGHPDFVDGHSALRRRNLHEEFAWDDAPLRCLHTCFLARSSRDAADATAASARPRENIMETHRPTPAVLLRRLWRTATARGARSEWKLSRYRRGEPVEVDAADFLPPLP